MMHTERLRHFAESWTADRDCPRCREVQELVPFDSIFAVLEGWQPIETAPKDGNMLLLWEGGYYKLGYQLSNGKWFEGFDTDFDPIYPTHWMPLPEPPSQSQGDCNGN